VRRRGQRGVEVERGESILGFDRSQSETQGSHEALAMGNTAIGFKLGGGGGGVVARRRVKRGASGIIWEGGIIGEQRHGWKVQGVWGKKRDTHKSKKKKVQPRIVQEKPGFQIGGNET